MEKVEVLKIGGYIPQCKKLHRKHYEIHDYLPGGDAPKDFVRAYFYKKGEVRARKWNYYIAKVGHKYYPIESITEHLLNELGLFFDMNMAESELASVSYGRSEQIRFFSKYFLNRRKEQLVHGADLYASYCGDEQFVKQIEAENREREMITVQDAQCALAYSFPQNDELFIEYIKLLLFDALVGNNDRHFYNWGCIKSLVSGDVRFSPIYDTARGLLWNHTDEELIKWSRNVQLKTTKLNKYVKKSTPKVGWSGIVKTINHFDLVGLIFDNELGMSKDNIRNFFDVNRLYKAREHILNGPYCDLMIEERLQLMSECLTLRYDKIQNIIT